MRGTAIWLAVGAMVLVLLWIESVRRSIESEDASARLWPRPDGSVPAPTRPVLRASSPTSFGEVWDLANEAA